MTRFGPTLLLALPVVVALAPHAADSTRTIDITVSRYAFSPERIEIRLARRYAERRLGRRHAWISGEEARTERPYPCGRQDGDGHTDAEGGRHVRDQLLRVLRKRSPPHEGVVDRQDQARKTHLQESNSSRSSSHRSIVIGHSKSRLQPRPEILLSESKRKAEQNESTFVLLVGLSLLAVGCGGSSPVAPSQGTITTSTFTVPLSSANESPAITNADAGSTGTATIALTVTKDDSGTSRLRPRTFRSASQDFRPAPR